MRVDFRDPGVTHARRAALMPLSLSLSRDNGAQLLRQLDLVLRLRKGYVDLVEGHRPFESPPPGYMAQVCITRRSNR